MSPIFLIGAGIVLLGVGLGLGYWFASAQRMREANRASSVQKELDDYRREVSRHFGDTAQHFQTLGQQYQALYKHMAEGAESLCDTSESDALLGFAADGAPAISVIEPESVTEAIRDYAPEDELPQTSVDVEVEAVEAADTEEEVKLVAEAAVEPSEDEVVAEPIVAAESAETERTVH